MSDDKREVTLDLEAGPAAFGDGEHPSTQLAVAILQELSAVFEPANILDMGCGSGVLSLVACQLWPECHVLAADIALSAVETTKRNATRNKASHRVFAVRSDGTSHLEIRKRAPFDLILCNITADPILAMTGELAKLLRQDGGLILLSGVLAWRMDEVLESFAQHGVNLAADRIEAEGGWNAALLRWN